MDIILCEMRKLGNRQGKDKNKIKLTVTDSDWQYLRGDGTGKLLFLSWSEGGSAAQLTRQKIN